MGSKGSHSSPPTPPPPPPPVSPMGWQFQWSKNLIAGQTPESFDFPTQDGVHYCVKSATGMTLTLGQTASIAFTITGDGTLVANDGGTPVHLRLFMQRLGDPMTGMGDYQFYRFWSSATADLIGPNTYTLSAKLDPTLWIPVGGDQYVPGPNYEQDKATGFAGCAANAQWIGFSFGGWSAGHGIYVKDGVAHFTLNNYTVA